MLILEHLNGYRPFAVEEVDSNRFMEPHTGWPLKLSRGNLTQTEPISGKIKLWFNVNEVVRIPLRFGIGSQIVVEDKPTEFS